LDSMLEQMKNKSMQVLQRLHEAGHAAYFAGGCVRDMIMGREPADYDIATDALPAEVVALFRRTVEVGARFGVVVVMIDDCHVEVATFRSDFSYTDGRRPDEVRYSSPREDAQRRDFTINGLFYDPLDDKIIDYVDGKADIEKKILRTIGDPRERFAEDHLRLLRAVRFSSRLGFEIESQTHAAIVEMADKVLTVSPERICAELGRMLCDPSRVEALKILDSTGLLERILPEISVMKGVEQPPNFHPEGDVFKHTLLSMSFLPDDISFDVAMGTLLHDIGKPPTFEIAGDRMRYWRHEFVGEKMARAVCSRLKMSRAATDTVGWLVKKHMTFKDAKHMRKSTLKKLLASEQFLKLASLCYADARASNGDVSDYEFCIKSLEEYTREQLKPRPLLSGRDLIDLGMIPGPIFSVILSRVYDEQLEGDLDDKNAALELAEKLAAEIDCGK